MKTSQIISLVTLLLWLPIALGIGWFVWANDLLDQEAWSTGPIVLLLYLLAVALVANLRHAVRGLITLVLVYSVRDLVRALPTAIRSFPQLLRWDPSSDYHWRPELLTADDPRVPLLAAHVNAGRRSFPPEELFGLARLSEKVGRRPVRYALRSIYDLSPRQDTAPPWTSVYSGDPRFGNCFKSKENLILFVGQKSLPIDVSQHAEAAFLLCEVDS